LNENLSALPSCIQQAIRSAPRQKWKSTFFELIVARILQELGATIEIEEINSAGKRPDFTAKFPDATVIVEAVSPVFNAEAGQTAKNRIPLLRIVESNIPRGWRVGVWELPNIGLSDSRKEFERAIKLMLSIPPPSDGAKDMELFNEISTGVIRLHLWPGEIKPNRLMLEAPITAFDNSEQRIRFALKRKRRQVRRSDNPVLLAIEASGISSEFEDFDKALFGRTYEKYNERRELSEIGFMPNGAFDSKGDKAPTYAGVLAFIEVGFLGGPAPIFYHHPRFSGSLPEEILNLEQRKYDKWSNNVQAHPARIRGLMERLKFVQT
jgi:hypothetical protein